VAQIQTEDEKTGTATQLDLFAEYLAQDLAREREERAKMLRHELDIVPAEEFAKAIGVTEQTLSGWRCSGEGPNFVRLGRGIFYRRFDIKAWIGRCGHSPAAKGSQ
jgi:predicted DNA-binding transcriptional regulator AlpA